MDTIKRRVVTLLRWSERYTKTDMVYLAKGGGWLLFGQGLVFLSSALLVWAFANFLPKDIYGQYRFLLSALSIAALAALPGMDTALARAIARGARGTLKPAVLAKLRWGLLGTLGSFIAAAYYAINNDNHLALLFVIIALFAPIHDTANSFRHYLHGLKDFRRDAFFSSIQRLVVAIVVGTTVILTSDVYIILLTFLIMSAVLSVFFFRQALLAHPLNDEVETDAITYGKQLSLVTAIRIAASHLDKVMLWYVAGPVSVASYAIAAAPPQEIMSAISHVNRLALPKMSVRENKELRATLLRKIGIFTLSVVPLVIGYVIAAPFIFEVFLSQYTDSVVYTRWLSLLFLFAPAGLFTQYFYTTKDIRALTTINTAEPILAIALYASLVPFFGIAGVIAATLGRVGGSALISLVFFMRKSPLEILPEEPSR